MRPTLEPGDRLLVLRRAVRAGDLVAVVDPRLPSRLMVKRVVAVDVDGSVTVAGDDPPASTDSRHFGRVPRDLVRGRVVYRYAPTARAGTLGSNDRARPDPRP
jgi:nickel-type superoxide dismutase maturation protease